MKKLMYLVVFMLILSAWISPANQGWNVTGRVTSADDGLPLPGVNIVVKGTTIGTTTDINGEYSIKVSGEKDVLVFSFIGYVTKSQKIGLNRKLDMKLSADVTQLSEVVVAGKVRKKDRMGYAAPSQEAMDMSYSGVHTQSYSQPVDVFEHNTESYSTIHENIFHDPKSKL